MVYNTFNLYNLFAQKALQKASSTALYFQSKKISFTALFQKSQNIGGFLQAESAQPNDIVGIFCGNHPDLLAGVFGVLAAGCAYLPLSDEYPDERLRYMIDDSKLKFILVQKELEYKIQKFLKPGIKCIIISEVKEYDCASRDSELAYVIYTSGSTGKPKGVLIKHESIFNQMAWLESKFNLSRQKILQKTPICFDAAQWELLAPAIGGSLVISPNSAYKNPSILIDLISEFKVEIIQCVPTLLQALLDHSNFQSCKSINVYFSGGEALSVKLAQDCLEKSSKARLVNLYGPTECTINASYHEVVLPMESTLVTVPIGQPIDNLIFHVLSEDLSSVLSGVVGELYIGGVGLSKGYIGDQKLTNDKFIPSPFSPNQMIYRTGDLVKQNPDGSFQFVARTDNQVKLRGYRVELDEIKSRIDAHKWVKNSAVVVNQNKNTNFQNLLAYVCLDSKEAALMDQDKGLAHHQSKQSRSQVKFQLNNAGLRSFDATTDEVVLLNKEPTKLQADRVFSRKTYRYFEGASICKDQILDLIKLQHPISSNPISLSAINMATLGGIMRYFGQFHSPDRLLPKYGYASPGALYATQIYIELQNIAHLRSGVYYYNPVSHKLNLVCVSQYKTEQCFKLHLIGKKSAIEPIYKNNIKEVLEIEAGHIVGLFEHILPEYGLTIIKNIAEQNIKQSLSIPREDYYLGSFSIDSPSQGIMKSNVDIYIQSHLGKVDFLDVGLYRYDSGGLAYISQEMIDCKDVVAINQDVYRRASFGVSIIGTNTDVTMRYLDLGRKLQQLQMNDAGIGLMSSGYSSRSGCSLPSALTINRILDENHDASYFCVGGKLSEAQILSRGMKEDAVHMKGPAELIREDLSTYLPRYMLPNKIMIINQMPATVNGKIDFKALMSLSENYLKLEPVKPRSIMQIKMSKIWGEYLKTGLVPINYDFFELGGNSLVALNLINAINIAFNIQLPTQIIFTSPTIELLLVQIKKNNHNTATRAVCLQPQGDGDPIFCWPGLGGYCMNMKGLGLALGSEAPFYGIQAHGLNQGELPYKTVKEMAQRDIELIRSVQPKGPYRLYGYSFGARVAFETAYQLEKCGEMVSELVLIAPGSPKLKQYAEHPQIASFENKAFLTILYSVFKGTIIGAELEKCLNTVNSQDGFIQFMTENSEFNRTIIERIINVVSLTFEFSYTFQGLSERSLRVRATILKAKGDDYSFIESKLCGISHEIAQLNVDHYALLKPTGVQELVMHLRLCRQSLLVA